MSDTFRGRKYSVVTYDSHWINQYKGEHKVLSGVFGDSLVRIEHVGSTAVPDMAGQPIVDVLVVVTPDTAVENYIPALQKVGYVLDGVFLDKELYQLSREINRVKLVTVRIFKEGHPSVASILSVRDYLLENPNEVRKFSRAKRAWKKDYPVDYAAYRQAKSDYLEELLKRIAEK